MKTEMIKQLANDVNNVVLATAVPYQKQIKQLRAENKRFRDALEDIASTHIWPADPNDNNVAHCYMDMAEQALKEPK